MIYLILFYNYCPSIENPNHKQPKFSLYKMNRFKLNFYSHKHWSTHIHSWSNMAYICSRASNRHFWFSQGNFGWVDVHGWIKMMRAHIYIYKEFVPKMDGGVIIRKYEW